MMAPAFRKFYNWAVIVASRGIGSVIITGLFLVKKLALPADEFGSLGHAFATALIVISPLASPIIMLISRRIIQSRDLARDRDFIFFWCLIAMGIAVFVAFQTWKHGIGIPDYVFLASVIAFILVTVLNAQYIIWLNESDKTARSMAFIVLFLLAIPASVAIRHATGIGQRDRAFSVETILLCIPVLIDVYRTKKNKLAEALDLYELSSVNYLKYFAIVMFYNGIIWVDWSVGRFILPEPIYLDWAEDRILFERILLPILNIVQVTLLWHLLRTSTRADAEGKKAIGLSQVRWFGVILAVFGALTFTTTLLAQGSNVGMLVSLAAGYLTYGLISIFLDFYQAKFSLKQVAAVLIGITAVRSVACYGAVLAGGVWGFALFWTISSAVTLWYIFVRSRDQIKF